MDVTKSLSFFTLLSNLFLIFLVIALIFKYLFRDERLWNRTLKILDTRFVLYSFIVAATATLGSLYFSEVAGYTPCKLCWFQRILMYPLSIILFVAILKKDKRIGAYVLPLSLMGVVLSSYHYYLQRASNPLSPCSTIGFSVSCSDKFFMQYNYITIPWMALSAFALISTLMLILYKQKN